MHECALQRLHWEPLLSMSTLLPTLARPPPELTPHFLPPQVNMHACMLILVYSCSHINSLQLSLAVMTYCNTRQYSNIYAGGVALDYSCVCLATSAL